MRSNLAYVLLLAFFAMAAVPVRATDVLDQLSPERPPSSQVPERAPSAERSPAEEEPSLEDDEILLDALKGIVIVAEKELASAEGLDGEVVVAGLPGSEGEKLSRLSRGLIGKPVSINDLKKLESELERFLQTRSSPVSDVYLPPQEITSGIVTFAVRERIVSELKLTGAVKFGEAIILKEFRTRPGMPVDSQTVTEDLLWLNQNPFRRVDLIYADGDTSELTKLQIQVNEQNPWRIYTGYNNYSNERVGNHRLVAGFQLGNLGMPSTSSMSRPSPPLTPKSLALFPPATSHRCPGGTSWRFRDYQVKAASIFPMIWI